MFSVYRPMYTKLMEERKSNAAKKQKQQVRQLRRDVGAAGEDTDACFVVPGRDAGAGLSLRLDNEDDSSSEEEENNAQGIQLWIECNTNFDYILVWCEMKSAINYKIFILTKDDRNEELSIGQLRENETTRRIGKYGEGSNAAPNSWWHLQNSRRAVMRIF